MARARLTNTANSSRSQEYAAMVWGLFDWCHAFNKVSIVCCRIGARPPGGPNRGGGAGYAVRKVFIGQGGRVAPPRPHETVHFRAHLERAGMASSSINRHLAALRSLTALGRMLGAITWRIEIPGVRVLVKRRQLKTERAEDLPGSLLAGQCGRECPHLVKHVSLIR